MITETPDLRYFRLALASFIGRGKPHNQSTLAAASGVSRSLINEVLHQKKSPGRAAQEKIATACEMSLGEFLTLGQRLDKEGGKSGENIPQAKLVTGDKLDGIKDIHPANLKGRAVESLGLAACSNIHWQKVLTSENKVTTSPVNLDGPGAFAMTVVGDSMVPAGIMPGQLVFCDAGIDSAIGDAVFIKLKDGYATLKVFEGWSDVKPANAKLAFVNQNVPKGDKWILLKGWRTRKEGEEDKVQQPYLLTVESSMIELIAPVIFVRRKA